MFLNQKGAFPILAVIILLLLAAATAFYAYDSGQVEEPLPFNSQLALPLPSILKTYIPASTSADERTPLPLLANSATFPQTEFKGGMDFPFTFYYPDYFEKTITDVEKRKLEVLEREPNYVWRLLSQARIGVSLTSSKYDYSDCSDVMRIFISKYANVDHTSLYDFIKTLNAEYAGNGITETFETYEKGLVTIDFPKPNSYQFTGNLSENPAKTVYFEHGDSFYSFTLSGGCNTGEGYSEDAENLFDSILKNLKFK